MGNILKDKNIMKTEAEENLDLDTEELKKHLDLVLREVKKGERRPMIVS